jgi:hypothetical protein
MFMKNLKVLLLALFLSSCAPHLDKLNYEEYSSSQDNQEYALVLFRPMFFDTMDDANKFITNPSSYSKLTTSNDITVSAALLDKKSSSTRLNDNLKKMVKYVGNKSNAPEDSNYKNFAYTVPSEVDTGFWGKPVQSLKPQYFYDLIALKPGKYFISRLYAFSNKLFVGLELMYKEEDKRFYFEVKPGVVNYLGDLYWINAKRTDGLFSNGVKGYTALLDYSNDAEKFLNQYYPNVKLKFVKSPLHNLK